MYIYVVPLTKYYSVQVLSTRDKNIATDMVEELSNKNLDDDIFITQNGSYFKVCIGKFADKNDLKIKSLYKKLRSELSYKSSKIVYLSR